MSIFIDAIAVALFNSGCLKFGSFKIKSGATSPYYIDLASLLSSPADMCCVANLAATKITAIRESGIIIDKLASIELKGALMLPLIGYRVGLPCLVVRKEDKAYGVTGRIAGAAVTKGDKILFFDDVISEGSSKLEGIKPIEAVGGQIEELLVVVDREQGGREKIESRGIKVNCLAKITELVTSLYNSKRISEEHKNRVTAYIKKRRYLLR